MSSSSVFSMDDRGDVELDARLLSENAELSTRLQRLGPALARMAHDLATTRRENLTLKRENLRLRAAIKRSETGAFDGHLKVAPASQKSRQQRCL